MRNGPYSTAWIRYQWLAELEGEYPAIDVREVAETLARKCRTGAYSPPPSARGLRRTLASWCEQERRRPGPRAAVPAGRPNPMAADLAAGGHRKDGSWEWGWTPEDQDAFGDSPLWGAYIAEHEPRLGYGGELGRWPTFSAWLESREGRHVAA